MTRSRPSEKNPKHRDACASDSSTKFGLATDGKSVYFTSSLHINATEDPIPSLKVVGIYEHPLCHSYDIPADYTGPRPLPIDERLSTSAGQCRLSPSNVADGVDVAIGFLLSSVNLSTLDLEWQYTSPLPSNFPEEPAMGDFYQGGTTVINDLVLVADRVEAPEGTFRILDKTNGRSIWTFSGANLPNSQATVSDGIILWGAGYFSSDSLYAFELCPVGKKAKKDASKCVPVKEVMMEMVFDNDDDNGKGKHKHQRKHRRH